MQPLEGGARLIAVGLLLEGTLDLDANVLSLGLRERSQLSAELLEVEASDLLVEVLGEHLDGSLGVLLGAALGPELDLSEGLVGEGGGHDERGVASGASEVDEAALGEEDDSAASVGEDEAVDLGLDVLALGGLHEGSDLDLIVKVANVAQDGVVLHHLHVLEGDDVEVSGGGDNNVNVVHDRVGGDDLESLHGGLESADGVALGDVDDAAVVLQRLGASFADISKAADEDLLSGEHNVGGTHDSVREGVLAAVQVIELGLGDGVVDVDGRKEEAVLAGHLLEAEDTGGGLLRDSNNAGDNLVPAHGVALELTSEDGVDNLHLLVGLGLRVRDGAILGELVLSLVSEVDQHGHVSTVVDDDVHAIALGVSLGPGHGSEGALPVLLEGLSLPGEDSGGLGSGHGSGGVVLGGEDVARAPTDISAEEGEGLDKDGSLDGHVERSSDPGTLERLVGVLGADSHETRHLNLSQVELLATEVSCRDQVDIC